MANKNFYTVEKEINGVKYTAQFNGISAALEAQDSFYMENSGNISNLKLAKYVLGHVIVDPKGLTPDDFKTVDELADVIAWGREVMVGDFRPEENEGKTK